MNEIVTNPCAPLMARRCIGWRPEAAPRICEAGPGLLDGHMIWWDVRPDLCAWTVPTWRPYPPGRVVGALVLL